MISINNKIESCLYDNFIKHKGISLLKKLSDNLPLKQIETYKIILKIIHMIIDYKANSEYDLTIFLEIIVKFMDKFENNSDIMIYNFDAIKKFSSLKKFEEFFSQNFLDIIIKSISNTEIHKVASIGLQILDVIVKISKVREMIRRTKPLTFIVKLLTRFINDDILSYVNNCFNLELLCFFITNY